MPRFRPNFLSPGLLKEASQSSNSLKAKTFRLHGTPRDGNLQTIDAMKQIAHARSTDPKIRDFAIQIAAGSNVGSHDYATEAYAIGEWVRQSIRYVRDPSDVEQITDPLTLLDQYVHGYASGDCDDMALLIATLLLSIGHSPYFRAVRYDSNSGPYNHIYVVCYEKDWGDSEKSRVVLDAILKDRPIGTEVPHASGDEFEV